MKGGKSARLLKNPSTTTHNTIANGNNSNSNNSNTTGGGVNTTTNSNSNRNSNNNNNKTASERKMKLIDVNEVDHLNKESKERSSKLAQKLSRAEKLQAKRKRILEKAAAAGIRATTTPTPHTIMMAWSPAMPSSITIS